MEDITSAQSGKIDPQQHIEDKPFGASDWSHVAFLTEDLDDDEIMNNPHQTLRYNTDNLFRDEKDEMIPHEDNKETHHHYPIIHICTYQLLLEAPELNT